MRIVSSLAAFATAAFAAFAFIAPAQAAPTIAGGVYMDQAVKNCGAVGFCEVEFAPVPAGKTLVITDAGCAVNTAAGIPLVSTTLRGRTAGGAVVNRNAYFSPLLTSTSGDRRYQMQMKPTVIMLAGEKPHVYLATSGAAAGFAANCTIAGELK